MNEDLLKQLPKDLARRSRVLHIGPSRVPALICHPDWTKPAPLTFWMHGRTAFKELDNGRYLRWVRAGIAACAIDLPGHGERSVAGMQEPERTLDVITATLPEIDLVVDDLARQFPQLFDTARMAIGGMSLGGMTTLRRLCDKHRFICASVEGTTGWLEGMYFPAEFGLPVRPWPVDHNREKVRDLDPATHLSTWKPIPLLALHSESDQIVPWPVQRRFLEQLRTHYRHDGADPRLVEAVTWPETGAPQEHAGFGRVANDAKNAQLEFLRRYLKPQPPE